MKAKSLVDVTVDNLVRLDLDSEERYELLCRLEDITMSMILREEGHDAWMHSTSLSPGVRAFLRGTEENFLLGARSYQRFALLVGPVSASEAWMDRAVRAMLSLPESHPMFRRVALDRECAEAEMNTALWLELFSRLVTLFKDAELRRLRAKLATLLRPGP